MRVMVIGASGAIGTRLVPQLTGRGHEVIGTHRSPGRAEQVRALGAKRPFRIPSWAARLIMGGEMMQMSSECRGASNAKAKKELDWTLRYPSWRKGFAAAIPRP